MKLGGENSSGGTIENVVDGDCCPNIGTRQNDDAVAFPAGHAAVFLRNYDTYGWEPDPRLSDDDNYMDLVMLLTRNSKLRQGSMACLLVSGETSSKTPMDRIICASTNQSFYKENDSDIHAEISALGYAASTEGVSTKHASSYTTMPPCKRCLCALHAARVIRIVSRVPPPKVIQEAARKKNIEVVTLSDDVNRRKRINSLVDKFRDGDRKTAGTEDQFEEHATKRRK